MAVKELDLVVTAAGRKHEAVVRRLHRIDLVLVRDLNGPEECAVVGQTHTNTHTRARSPVLLG